ncbi:MAG TPA: hypothetical protein VHC01_14810 [Gaiellaceae bacterium]|nr:hypothetical protein [Gaiellaceae bacterium]
MTDPQFISLGEHPHAGGSIRRVKAWAGLAGFLVAALAGYGTGLPTSTLLLRALLFGIVGNCVGWAVSVAVWRRVLAAQALATVRARNARQTESKDGAAE